MIALKISDLKDFMNKLLIDTDFDSFCLAEATITTFNTFSIDGTIHKDFFDTDAREQLEQNHMYYSPWKEVRPWCYSVIRGKRTPVSFQFIFQVPYKNMRVFFEKLPPHISPEMIQGLYMNVQYKNKELSITSGISLRSFFPDKTPEYIWDTLLEKYLKEHGIAYEIP